MRKLFLLFLAVFFLAVGCHTQSPLQTETIIEWVDFIKFGDKEYDHAYSLILADRSTVTEIGEVQFTVNDHIHNTQYQVKNGDAAYLKKGTKLFSREGEPNYIAAKDPSKPNGYSLYEQRETVQKTNFKEIDYETIRQIDVYKRIDDKPILELTLKDPRDIHEFMALLDNGEVNSDYVSNQDDLKMFDLVIDCGHAYSYRFDLFYDGEAYYASLDDTVLLPGKLENYFKKSP